MLLTTNSTADFGFEWGSGKTIWKKGNGPWNNSDDRLKAAQELADHVMANLTLVQGPDGKMVPSEDITLIGHSHGGNVAIQAAPIIREQLDARGGAFADLQIHLVTVATPAMNFNKSENPAESLEAGVISSHIGLFSSEDQISPDKANLFGGYNNSIIKFDAFHTNPNSMILELQSGGHSVDFEDPGKIEEVIERSGMDLGGKIEISKGGSNYKTKDNLKQ